jgi:predicted DNA-binding transcriptional regulator YafY
MTAEVLRRMDHQLTKQNLFTVGDLLHAQGAPIYTPPPPRVDLLPPLDEAVARQQDVQILYIGKEGATDRRITPRYATEHRGWPYLVAYCHLRQELRTFRLDRIMSAALI